MQVTGLVKNKQTFRVFAIIKVQINYSTALKITAKHYAYILVHIYVHTNSHLHLRERQHIHKANARNAKSALRRQRVSHEHNVQMRSNNS